MHPRPAATVILVRDPYEVLMVRRNPELAFMGGFWVFPGGKVDDVDASAEQAARRELREEAAISLVDGADLIPFARWITPVELPIRFDTLFFLANAHDTIDGDVATADGSEIVETRWVRPQTALEDGSPLAFPTRKQLERLSEYRDTAGLFAASRNQTIIPILPEIVHRNGSEVVVVPDPV